MFTQNCSRSSMISDCHLCSIIGDYLIYANFALAILAFVANCALLIRLCCVPVLAVSVKHALANIAFASCLISLVTAANALPQVFWGYCTENKVSAFDCNAQNLLNSIAAIFLTHTLCIIVLERLCTARKLSSFGSAGNLLSAVFSTRKLSVLYPVCWGFAMGETAVLNLTMPAKTIKTHTCIPYLTWDSRVLEIAPSVLAFYEVVLTMLYAYLVRSNRRSNRTSVYSDFHAQGIATRQLYPAVVLHCIFFTTGAGLCAATYYTYIYNYPQTGYFLSKLSITVLIVFTLFNPVLTALRLSLHEIPFNSAATAAAYNYGATATADYERSSPAPKPTQSASERRDSACSFESNQVNIEARYDDDGSLKGSITTRVTRLFTM